MQVKDERVEGHPNFKHIIQNAYGNKKNYSFAKYPTPNKVYIASSPHFSFIEFSNKPKHSLCHKLSNDTRQK